VRYFAPGARQKLCQAGTLPNLTAQNRGALCWPPQLIVFADVDGYGPRPRLGQRRWRAQSGVCRPRWRPRQWEVR